MICRVWLLYLLNGKWNSGWGFLLVVCRIVVWVDVICVWMLVELSEVRCGWLFVWLLM